MGHAAGADRFFREKWGNPFLEGLFWQAVCAYRMGRKAEALSLARKLKELRSDYPRLDTLLKRLSE